MTPLVGENAATSVVEGIKFVEVLLRDCSPLQLALIGSIVTSVVPVLTVMLLPRRPSKFFLSLLVALAAGAMLGDALLHQLPSHYASAAASQQHAGGCDHHGHDHDGHHHDHHQHDHDHHDHGHMGHTREMSLIFAGIATFFVMDGWLRGRHAHDDDGCNGKAKQQAQAKSRTQAPSSPRALLCIVADVAHNFTDGIVIGAAVISGGSLSASVRTVMAVMAHELPHELGDIAVLMDGGMSRFRVAGVQLLTGAANVAGAVAVVVAAAFAHDAAATLGPFVTGTFLYMSLATLLGDVTRSNQSSGLSARLWHVLAFAIGFMSMDAMSHVEDILGAHAH